MEQQRLFVPRPDGLGAGAVRDQSTGLWQLVVRHYWHTQEGPAQGPLEVFGELSSSELLDVVGAAWWVLLDRPG